MALEKPDERTSPVRDDEDRTVDEETHHLDPDVVLDVPMLNVEELHLEVDDLQARISVQAEVANFVKVNVGVDAHVNKAKLSIKGVEAQIQLKVRLEGVLSTIERALDSIDANPGLLGGTSRDEHSGAAEIEASTEPSADGAPEETSSDEEVASGGADDQDAERATDAARRKASQLGVRLSGLRGTGAGGRVLVRDVEKAASD